MLLTTLKRAEDNTGWILRLVEIAGRAARAQVHLPVLNFHAELSFRPMEIKTLRVQEDGSFVEVLLTEMPFAR